MLLFLQVCEVPHHLPYLRYCLLQGSTLVHLVLNQKLAFLFPEGCKLGLGPIRANCYSAPWKQKLCLSAYGLLNQASRECLIRTRTHVPIVLSFPPPVFFFFLPLVVNFCSSNCFYFLEIDIFTGIKKGET